jgi:hypothetical protein
MKLKQLQEAAIQMYYIKDEDVWYTGDIWDHNSEPLSIHTPGLRLIGMVLSKEGYRPDEIESQLYAKDGKLYIEEVLSGDNDGTAFPISVSVFQIPEYFEHIGKYSRSAHDKIRLQPKSDPPPPKPRHLRVVK